MSYLGLKKNQEKDDNSTNNVMQLVIFVRDTVKLC